MFARVRVRRARSPATSDVVAGVSDASAVLFQLRVGGQAARHTDETFPHACGCIGQETTGPGGLAKALRTVPGRPVARRGRAPARPAGRVDRRLHQPGRHRHARAADRGSPGRRAVQRGDRVPAPVRDDARRALRRRSRSTTSGLNHLTWVRGASVDGVDRLPGAAVRAPARDRRRGRAARRPAVAARRRAVVLPALLLRARRGARRADRRPAPSRARTP